MENSRQWTNPRLCLWFVWLCRILPTHLVFISGYANKESVSYWLNDMRANITKPKKLLWLVPPVEICLISSSYINGTFCLRVRVLKKEDYSGIPWCNVDQLYYQMGSRAWPFRLPWNCACSRRTGRWSPLCRLFMFSVRIMVAKCTLIRQIWLDVGF